MRQGYPLAIAIPSAILRGPFLTLTSTHSSMDCLEIHAVGLTLASSKPDYLYLHVLDDDWLGCLTDIIGIHLPFSLSFLEPLSNNDRRIPIRLVD